MINQGKNIVIGLFVLAALAIFVFILLYLHPTVGDMGKTINVRFNNIDKINVGTRVNLAGKPVGEVVAIKEVPEARLQNGELGQPVYIYQLTLKVDSHIKLYKSDLFSVSTSGLLGEKSIEVTPARLLPGETAVPITSKDIIYAEPSISVEEVVKDVNRLSKKIELAVDNVNGQLNEIKQRKIWENVASTIQNLNDITAALNQPKDLSEIVKNLHLFSFKINDLSDKASTTLDNFHRSSLDLGGITGRIAKGEGSFGKLLSNEDFYLRLTSIMSKADVLMDDINHYGLLFQNNKSWQRLRARRLNLLDQLSTPQEFRNYFNDEIDQISSSLSRVNLVLEGAGECMEEEVISSREFAKVFAELLLRVKTLEENLFFYDQQVVEIRSKEMYNGIMQGTKPACPLYEDECSCSHGECNPPPPARIGPCR